MNIAIYCYSICTFIWSD